MTVLEPAVPIVEAHLPDPRRWKALGVLALMQFMLVLDITVVNVALPHIKADLGFTRSGLTWVVDAYVLMAGGLLLLGGRLADLVGRRRMFIIGISVFAVASALSGAAASSGMLVASRFAQGAAEAMAAPAAFGLTALLFPDGKERAKALGIFGGVAGLGGTLGPVISGLILQSLSWRWIFFVNIPVAIFAVVAVNRLVDESRADAITVSASRHRPDLTGAVLVTSGLIAVVYGLISAAGHPWGSASVAAPIAVGGGLLVAFVVRERTATNPLVPLRFFANRTRVTANLVTLLFSAVFFTMFFLLTLFWEQAQHYSALRTGFAYLPFGVGIGLGIALSANLVPKVGVRPLLAAGFGLGALGMLDLTRITVHGSYLTQALPGLILMAIGSGLCFSGFANASVHEVSHADASLASGVQNAVQQVGGAIGLAVLATLALRHGANALTHGTAPMVAATDGYVLAWRIGAVVLAVGAVLVVVLMERLAPAAPVPVPSGVER
ncbi:MAG: DHA2 family efflux MFS transporter permease subunit [Actinomycetota bacterium]|nr:DHA2 family efflux MFS transporter permease subunit [Actinomycetota bacterium]